MIWWSFLLPRKQDQKTPLDEDRMKIKENKLKEDSLMCAARSCLYSKSSRRGDSVQENGSSYNSKRKEMENFTCVFPYVFVCHPSVALCICMYPMWLVVLVVVFQPWYTEYSSCFEQSNTFQRESLVRARSGHQNITRLVNTKEIRYTKPLFVTFSAPSS